MAIQLTPHGHLVPYAAELALLPDAVARDLTARAAQSSADLLSWLGTRALTQPLPTAGVFWREWARTYFARLSREPARVGSLPVPDPGEVAERVLGAPPLPGGEYLTPDVLTRLWAELDARVLLAAGGHAGGVGGWLHEQNPVWNQVGRVMFHLAENKRDPAWPFAFLATYTHRISDQARPQHLPLGRALQEYAGGNQRSALVALLAPVERGAARSPFLRERVDSQRIFQPQRWTPREAHRFLSEVSALEDSGVQVRLPDWWRGGRPDRPTVSVTVGGRPAWVWTLCWTSSSRSRWAANP